LTGIPDERFVEVLHSAYVRFQSLYALAEPRFEVRENKVYVVGKWPICGADYDVEHNIQVPFSPGLSCRNTAIGKCNNNLEFHFNLYKIPELERHARSVRERLKGLKRVAFVGDDYSIKFLLAYDIFGVRIDDILGMCSFYPQITGQYLYGDAFGNCTPNSLFYTVEEIVGLQPEAMIIAEMSPASRVMQDTLVQMGCDAEKIYPMCPEGTIPYLDGHEYWRPLKTVYSQARVVVWPVGDLGRRLIEGGVLGGHQVVAFADSARSRWKTAFMGKTIFAPEELSSIDFDSIVVATPAEDRGVAWVPIHNDPFLAAKDLYCVSEHSGILYLLYVRGNQMLKHAVPGSTHRDVQP